MSSEDTINNAFTSYTDSIVRLVNDLHDRIDELENRIKILENSKNNVDNITSITYDNFMANLDSFIED